MIKLKKEENFILWGILGLFLMGAAWHFLYDLFGQNIVIGIVAPKNESVWEHLKLILLPFLLWWSIYYLVNFKKNNININKWFTSMLISIIFSMISMIGIYYIYHSGLGISSVFLDIVLLLVSDTIGLLLGLHIYKNTNGIKWWLAIIIFSVIFIVFVIFTFIPPNLPIFISAV